MVKKNNILYEFKFFEEFIDKINWFDIGFILILIYFVTNVLLKVFFKCNFFHEMDFFFGSYYYSSSKISTMGKRVHIESEFVNNVGLGLVIFIITLFLTILVGKSLGRAVTWTGVGSIDKTFGLFLDFLKDI